MRKKNYKVLLRLSHEEARLAIGIMIEVRNKYLAQGIRIAGGSDPRIIKNNCLFHSKPL